MSLVREGVWNMNHTACPLRRRDFLLCCIARVAVLRFAHGGRTQSRRQSAPSAIYSAREVYCYLLVMLIGVV